MGNTKKRNILRGIKAFELCQYYIIKRYSQFYMKYILINGGYVYV